MCADGGGPRVGLKAKAGLGPCVGKCWLGAMQAWHREQTGTSKHDVHAWELGFRGRKEASSWAMRGS